MDQNHNDGPDDANDEYHELLDEEILFSQATGYDKEKTAVVPLAQLARRAEERHSRQSAVEQQKEKEAPARTDIPVGEVIDVLRAARSVEEVAGVLVEMVANLVPRVLLFWERKGTLYGFASRGMGLEEVKLLTIELPVSFLRDLTCAELSLDSFRGPPRKTELVQRLYQVLGGDPPEVMVLPVWITHEDRWILYADNVDQVLPEFELRLIEIIVARAGARADLLMDGQHW